VDYCEREGNTNKWRVLVTAKVRLTVYEIGRGRRDVYREDLGVGAKDNVGIRAQALEQSKKEAVTDGLKRAARQYGNLLGNCLYNKQYLVRVSKVKGPVSRIDFDEDELYRKSFNKRKRAMAQSVMSTDTDDKMSTGTEDTIKVITELDDNTDVMGDEHRDFGWINTQEYLF
jgi:DNA repair and recombination protein RAD52